MRVSIEKTEPDDVQAIAFLEKQCFSMPLTEEQIRSLIAMENTCFLTAKRNRNDCGNLEIVGYIGMQTVLDEGYIINIAVSESCRHQGIADALMNCIEEESLRKYLSFVTLEVRESNDAAISLYKKHGYHETGRRFHYYNRPKEDALIFTKCLPERNRTEDSK